MMHSPFHQQFFLENCCTPNGSSKGHSMNIVLTPLNSIQSVVGLGQPLVKSQSVSGTGFSDALSQALKGTSALQKESGLLSKEFTLENPTVSLEETILAGVRSNISFQANLQVRNRLVQAYTDIFNMQI